MVSYSMCANTGFNLHRPTTVGGMRLGSLAPPPPPPPPPAPDDGVENIDIGINPVPGARGLHSSTFWLNTSTCRWMRWVHDSPPVY